MELPKIYNPNNVEEKWYKHWEENNIFSPNDDNDTFTIMIPPPNVTGQLHLGHVLNNTIQDIIIRKAKMEGKNTLWVPGTDHASIATETKVTNTRFKVYGTIVNTSDTTILAPWYIEAMFYADSTFSTTFGGDNERMNFPLEPGVTFYWTLDHRSESVIEADYPDFKIKDLRAFIKK